MQIGYYWSLFLLWDEKNKTSHNSAFFFLAIPRKFWIKRYKITTARNMSELIDENSTIREKRELRDINLKEKKITFASFWEEDLDL